MHIIAAPKKTRVGGQRQRRGHGPDLIVKDGLLDVPSPVERVIATAAGKMDQAKSSLFWREVLHAINQIWVNGELQESTIDALAETIFQAQEQFILSQISAGLVADVPHRKITSPVVSHGELGLSRRQQLVLRLLAEGHTVPQIAGILGLSVKTVKTHEARLKEKLGLRGRANLVRYAIESGLLDVDE